MMKYYGSYYCFLYFYILFTWKPPLGEFSREMVKGTFIIDGTYYFIPFSNDELREKRRLDKQPLISILHKKTTLLG